MCSFGAKLPAGRRRNRIRSMSKISRRSSHLQTRQSFSDWCWVMPGGCGGKVWQLSLLPLLTLVPDLALSSPPCSFCQSVGRPGGWGRAFLAFLYNPQLLHIPTTSPFFPASDSPLTLAQDCSPCCPHSPGYCYFLSSSSCRSFGSWLELPREKLVML